MQFKSGMLGVCIVVVALLGSVLGGFLLDVEKTNEPITNYNYVTDVTGLFNISEAPEHIEYNPASNYVGYGAGQVSYVESSSVNAYRYVMSPGTTSTTSITVNSSSNFTVRDGFNYGTVGSLLRLSGPVDKYGSTQNTLNTGAWANINGLAVGGGDSRFKVSTLETVFNSMGMIGATADISVSYGAHDVFFIPHGDYTFIDVARGDGETQYIYYISSTANYTPSRFTVSLDTGVVSAYIGVNKVWETLASNVDVIYYYSDRSGGSWANQSTASATLNATVTSYPVYGYADPSGGVILAPGSAGADWSNGYVNSEVFVTAHHVTAGTAQNIEISADDGANLKPWVRVMFSASGDLSVRAYNARIGYDVTKTLGTWASCQIHFNFIEGSVSITPIIGAPDYMASVDENSSTYTFTGWCSGLGDVSNLDITSSGVRWGITKTMVFLNTYNAVMFNPSINITDYFPDYEGWRLNFYSFATIGESITVNNQTFPVTDGQITITDGRKEITGQVNDLYVNRDLDNNIWFGFSKGGVLNLGPAITNVVSFTGLWYFTTGLYEAVEGVQESYNWNIDSNWHATAGQAVILFLALMVGGVVGARFMLKTSLKGMDWVFIVGGFVFALIIGGSLI